MDQEDNLNDIENVSKVNIENLEGKVEVYPYYQKEDNNFEVSVKTFDINPINRELLRKVGIYTEIGIVNDTLVQQETAETRKATDFVYELADNN